MNKRLSLVFGLGLALVSQVVSADILGVANGRAADFSASSQISVEGGLSIADETTTLGARANFKLSDELVLFGDLGRVDFSGGGADDADGLALGIGGFYLLNKLGLTDKANLAFKGSFHRANVEFDNCRGNCDIDLGEFALELLASKSVNSETVGLSWYANVGVHLLSVEFPVGFDDDDTELSFGGGITGNIPLGEWYAGLDFIDDLTLRGGFRYNL